MRYSDFKLVEYEDLNKEKEQIIQTISGLTADNADEAALLDRIWKILNSGQISTNINNAFDLPLADENMSDKAKLIVRQDMTKILSNIESDYASMNSLLKKLESSGGAVNISELAKPINTFSNVFGDATTIAAFKALASYGVGKNQKGPGEYGLACLSNKIKLAEGEGDLEIEGIGKVELKAAMSSSGGRIGYGGGSQKAKRAVLDKYASKIPTIVDGLAKKSGGSVALNVFIQALNKDLPVNDPANQKVRKAIMLDLLAMDMENYADAVADKIATTEDPGQIELAYISANFEWYKNRDHFDALLVMNMPNQKTAMIRNVNDLVAFRTGGHGGSMAISVIPTQAGAGREQWAQMNLNKAKI